MPRALLLLAPALLLLPALPAQAAPTTLWFHADGSWSPGPLDAHQECGGTAPLTTTCTIPTSGTGGWAVGLTFSPLFTGYAGFRVDSDRGVLAAQQCLVVAALPVQCTGVGGGIRGYPTQVVFVMGASLDEIVRGAPAGPVLPIAAGDWTGTLDTA
ncbi:MAG: hypothetical protein LC624_08240 [Halobacteriales archaeon]|nr:hypothetical protein [Halobacteriales archaeon]